MRKQVRSAAPDWLVTNGAAELARARDFFAPATPPPQPPPGAKKSFTFSAYSQLPVKQGLRAMFGGKCAYCEAVYDATQPEDVEHYRPKGRIDTGSEELTPGYWWLAASWENLLPSCIDCNRERTQTLVDGTVLKSGKGDRFPIDDETRRGRKEGHHLHEAPLLINPCEDDPAEFLRFVDADGNCIVEPVTNDMADLRARRARASIDIYGLNRARLVLDRTRSMIRIKTALALLESFARDLETADDVEASRLEGYITQELKLLGTYLDGTDDYTAMAVSFIKPVFDRLGLTLPA